MDQAQHHAEHGGFVPPHRVAEWQHTYCVWLVYSLAGFQPILNSFFDDAHIPLGERLAPIIDLNAGIN